MDLEKIINDKTGGANTPEKLFDLINSVHLQLDQRLDNVESLVDNQGTDLVRCITYCMAIEAALIDLKLLTKEQFQSYLERSLAKIREEFLTEPAQNSLKDVEDIEI